VNESANATEDQGTSHWVTINTAEYGEELFKFLYRADGTGHCIDLLCGGDPIKFNWDPTLIRGLEEPEVSEQLKDHARQLFWDEINEQLCDERVLTVEDFGGEEVSFECGSEDELERIVHLILYSFPALWENDRERVEVNLFCATNDGGGDAQLDDDCDLATIEDVPKEDVKAINALIDLALTWNEPVGSHLEYNDGATNRASGYCETPNCVCFTVPRPSFHELAEARESLRQTLLGSGAVVEDEQLLPIGG